MLRTRVISAVVLVALVVSAMGLLPPLPSTLALTALLAACTWEWSGFQGRGLPGRALFALITLAFSALLWRYSADLRGLHRILWSALIFWTLAAVWVLLLPKPVNRAITFVAGVLALSFAWLALARMRMDWQLGAWWVMYALLIVWVTDSCAYFAGRAWGKRKLAPRVSPGKTWAGLFGGLAGAAVLGVVAQPWLARSAAPLAVLTVLVALYSAAGDLTESLFKRYAGLKDSGSLIPGHGGFLDRFDSLLAAAPVLMLGASWLGRLPI
ncbi:MAG: phosphatidate cytidylyltransferase [Nevskiaceae bacterium]|jgi:phosphatidate cytidylyltransferase|nr:phosphatidate cytidylyltransferase [Nevskiaceae bacterium]